MQWLFLILFITGFGMLSIITRKFTVNRSLTKEGAIWVAIATFVLFIITAGIVSVFNY